MNIFALDDNPKIAAQYHNNAHCVKMILECSQLLCTAHRVLDGKEVIEKTASGRNIKRWKLEDERDVKLYKSKKRIELRLNKNIINESCSIKLY